MCTVFNKFYIIFIIYSVLRNVGPQPVGLLLLTYLINEHHNVNFPLVRIVYFSSLLKTTRNPLVPSRQASTVYLHCTKYRCEIFAVLNKTARQIRSGGGRGNDRQNRLSRAVLMQWLNVRNLRAAASRLRLAENRYVQLRHSWFSSTIQHASIFVQQNIE